MNQLDERDKTMCRSWQKSVFGPRYVGLDYAEMKMDADLRKPFQSWMKDPRGFCVISGSFGCGKTALGSSLIPYLYRLGVLDAYYVTEKDFFGQLKSTFGQSGSARDHIRETYSGSFVFYDDLGTVAPKEEQDGNWRRDMLFDLIDLRYSLHGGRENLAGTIITTNLTKESLVSVYGPRIADRILADENTWIDTQHLESARQHGM